jgi:hypothetical protein
MNNGMEAFTGINTGYDLNANQGVQGIFRPI